jgi:hypothetical protein
VSHLLFYQLCPTYLCVSHPWWHPAAIAAGRRPRSPAQRHLEHTRNSATEQSPFPNVVLHCNHTSKVHQQLINHIPVSCACPCDGAGAPTHCPRSAQALALLMTPLQLLAIQVGTLPQLDSTIMAMVQTTLGVVILATTNYQKFFQRHLRGFLAGGGGRGGSHMFF